MFDTFVLKIKFIFVSKKNLEIFSHKKFHVFETLVLDPSSEEDSRKKKNIQIQNDKITVAVLNI